MFVSLRLLVHVSVWLTTQLLFYLYWAVLFWRMDWLLTSHLSSCENQTKQGRGSSSLWSEAGSCSALSWRSVKPPAPPQLLASVTSPHLHSPCCRMGLVITLVIRIQWVICEQYLLLRHRYRSVLLNNTWTLFVMKNILLANSLLANFFGPGTVFYGLWMFFIWSS